MKYNLNVSAMYKTGRLNQVLLPFRGFVAVSNTKISVEVLAAYVYHKMNGFEIENDLISRIVFAAIPNNRFHPVGGFSYETSQLFSLEYRHAPGFGMGWHISSNEKNLMLLHVFASYEQAEFMNADGYETARINFILFNTHHLIDKRLDLVYRIFYFQSVTDSDNYIFRTETKFMFKLNKHLAFTLNMDYRYDAIVDPMNTNVNSSLTAGLQLSGIK